MTIDTAQTQQLTELWNKHVPEYPAKRVYVEPCKFYPAHVSYYPRFLFAWVKPQWLRYWLMGLFQRPEHLGNFWSIASIVGELYSSSPGLYKIPIEGHWEDAEQLTQYMIDLWTLTPLEMLVKWHGGYVAHE